MSDPNKETSSTQPPAPPDPATVASNAALSAEASARHSEAAAELSQDSALAAEKALEEVKRVAELMHQGNSEVLQLLLDMRAGKFPAVPADVTEAVTDKLTAEEQEKLRSASDDAAAATRAATQTPFGAGGPFGVFG